MYQLATTTRVRRSPYFAATVGAGVRSFTTYNHMLLPSGYGDPVAEYWRLIEGVSQWDVAAQRQVELLGPDAARLAHILVPRDLSECAVGRGKYVALCNHAGTLINDPILLKLAPDRFWLSIADSNIMFWARAVAAERGLRVTVTEADVSPMAVQGPKAEEVVAALFGDWVRTLGYFHFRDAALPGIPLMLARSGWSKQGGFELYLMDRAKGFDLWNIVREAGQAWDIGPGNPNPAERIESGLLSWGGDTDDATNPYEVRLGKYVDTHVGDDVIGVSALRRIQQDGAARHQLGVILEGDSAAEAPMVWYPIRAAGRQVGHMTCGAWSYRMKRNIGFGLVSREATAGAAVEVIKEDGAVAATLTELPFL